MIIPHPLNNLDPDIGWRYIDSETKTVFPWYTYGCLRWLTTLNLAKMSVFEYGCGLSSIWWKQQARSWQGVDSNEKWSEGALITQDMHTYVHAPNGTYDIIVVDGLYRIETALQAVHHVAKGGFIIVDNWDQETVGYPEQFWAPVRQAYQAANCMVHKEPEHPDWKTAIFEFTT